MERRVEDFLELVGGLLGEEADQPGHGGHAVGVDVGGRRGRVPGQKASAQRHVGEQRQQQQTGALVDVRRIRAPTERDGEFLAAKLVGSTTGHRLTSAEKNATPPTAIPNVLA